MGLFKYSKTSAAYLLTSVYEIQYSLHSPGRYVLNKHLALSTLLQIAREHGLEIATGGAQHNLVTRKLNTLHIYEHIRELVLIPEAIKVRDHVGLVLLYQDLLPILPTVIVAMILMVVTRRIIGNLRTLRKLDNS